MDRRTLIMAGGAVVAAAGAGAWYLNPQEDAAAPATARLLGAPNEFGIDDMTMGDATAPIEIVEYASFTCPHCATFHANAFKELKENYIDTGKVHFGYREVYFDRPGLWASLVARCGGPLRFFSIADMIYTKQREWLASGDPALIADELRTLGKVAGLDETSLDACLNNGELAQNLNAWYKTNSERDGITSTPSFMIDGEKFSNMSYTEFAAILDEKLTA